MALVSGTGAEGAEPPDGMYLALRGQVLETSPGGPDWAGAEGAVAAILMETGYPEGIATLVAVADGTTSLYLSNGGGTIGAGDQPAVAEAARGFIEACAAALPQLAPVADPALPPAGTTQFIAVTARGLAGARAVEDELGAGGHPLSPLFYAGHSVLSQVRLLQGG